MHRVIAVLELLISSKSYRYILCVVYLLSVYIQTYVLLVFTTSYCTNITTCSTKLSTEESPIADQSMLDTELLGADNNDIQLLSQYTG